MRAGRAAWWLGRLGLWALALPVLKRGLPLRTLARLMWAAPRRPGRRPDQEARIVRYIGWLYGAGRGRSEGNCLNRSLLTYRYLAAQNAGPHLVIGLGRGPGPFQGHAWVIVDGRPVYEAPAGLAPFTPVVTFGAGGRPLPAPGESS